MVDFTVYCYQCCPVKLADTPKNEIEHEEFKRIREEQHKRADENMLNHQQIIDRILTEDADELFKSQKGTNKGKLENCKAFYYQNKPYPFITLIPKSGEKGNGIYMLRIAKLGKKSREENWHKVIEPHEPSAIVIIDNRYDQQRILIEHRSEWGNTDAVRNVMKASLDRILREKYNLTIRIEPVWQKSDFWVALRKYEGHIRTLEFDIGYPNMGRTGNKLLKGIKDECKLMYASPTIKLNVPKEAASKKKGKKGKQEEEKPSNLNLDPEYQDGLVGELWENSRQNGRKTKLTLDNKRLITFGRKPNNAIKQMNEEERKAYEDNPTQMYSTSTISFNESISNFNGQDDLFNSTYQTVEDTLTALSTRNE